MMLEGPETDPEGRQFVLDTHGEDKSLYPPDLLVVTSERELLGRLPYSASAEETVDFLQGVLKDRPDLAPPVDPLAEYAYDLSDPKQAELAGLEERWDSGERASLVAPLEDWLSRHGRGWEHGSATARTLLGAARYHAGDFAGADESWTDVVEQHAGHPLRHRAAHNLLNAEGWGMSHHPDISEAPEPRIGIDGPVIIPNKEVRTENLKSVYSDPSYTITKSGLPLVRIPAGTFVMGGQPAAFSRELPLRRVTISRPFLISAWPVTRGLWRRFRPDEVPKPLDPHGDEIPMTRTSHPDAEAFSEFLSAVDGLHYRLATEAEWEYASRGGLEGAPHPWGHDPPNPTLCNYEHSRGVPVASYPPNGYGLFEMVGNTKEWVADGYLETAYALTRYEVTDPIAPTEKDEAGSNGPSARSAYVIRGGYAGPSFCFYMMRNALRLMGAWAGVRVVAEVD